MEPETTRLSHRYSPRLPIPPVLRMSEPGSFAQYTLKKRLPAIVGTVISDNALSQSALANLGALAQELSSGTIRPIEEDGGADVAAWSSYVKPFEGNSWQDLPFYFAEAYFYRRILEAIAYFQTDAIGSFAVAGGSPTDPFARQKHLSLETAREAIRTIVSQIPASNPSFPNPTAQTDDLIRLLYLSLWGNRVDLSLWSASTSSRIRTQVEQDTEHILINHSHAVVHQLSQMQGARFDWTVDNAGFELVCDLVLVDFLLSSGIAQTVCLHLKPHPIFVSDALIADVHQTLEVLSADSHAAVRSFASRLQSFLTSNRLCLREGFFWTAPLPLWEMPALLRQELSQSQLVFVKGDANYRRLIGDCHWTFTTPLEDIANYFPTPFVALRTLKSQVMTGLRSEQIDRLTKDDPTWLINGQWGMIHWINPQ
ncbi:damage-control phosphatase ARMT1 family protein [Leptolyngbya ohadii]|uniref:damage-control phosphatase ARMT1 family protein n=1 Tax=Leptolyngbya ohadii TaxID=1962290 RepID=UPI00117BC529|nr:damage-control phosphatase ARMT1 family protein [Leptolyngbya ohadii]